MKKTNRIWMIVYAVIACLMLACAIMNCFVHNYSYALVFVLMCISNVASFIFYYLKDKDEGQRGSDEK